MIEFKVGDSVTYKPYNDEHHMYVVQVGNHLGATFQASDIPLYGLSREQTYDPRYVTSVTSGRSIMESRYFQPCADMEL